MSFFSGVFGSRPKTVLIGSNVYTCTEEILGGYGFLSLPANNESDPATLIYRGKDVLENKNKKPESNFYIADNLYAAQIDGFLSTGRVTLYRGVPRWHGTWGTIQKAQPLASFGTGNYPDFNTRNTRFIPFTAELSIAELAARSVKGMDSRDRLEYVESYTKSMTFPIGLVLDYHATSKDALGFFNYSEVQIGGPIRNYWITQTIRMGTPLGDIFPRARLSPTEELDMLVRTGQRNEMSDMMPDVASEQEKQAYIRQYGGLIK
jgi:hypothetical protein